MANQKTESVTLKVSDGTEMLAFVARSNQDRKAPALLVLQEAFGVNSHIRDVAVRFAQEGFLSIAPELFHRTAAPGWEGNYEDLQSIAPHFQGLSPQGITNDLQACVDWLKKDGQANPKKMGSIGFCLGGRTSFFANSLFPLEAAISFYGGRILPDMLPLAEKQHGPIMLIWGGQDKHIGIEQQRAVNDALRKAGKPFVDVEFSFADHGFFCDERKSYNAPAAAQAWALSLSFLKEYLC